MARRNSYNGKYALSKSELLSAKYYALRYKEWVSEMELVTDTVHAMAYDGNIVQGNGSGNPTEKLAIRRAELTHKIRNIEESAKEADEDLHKYILLAVTEEDMTFDKLRRMTGIPCGKDLYYHIRRKFFYILAKRI